ncbi:MAG: hypothetical protein ABI828_04550 [Actinomycetota bacterium]
MGIRSIIAAVLAAGTAAAASVGGATPAPVSRAACAPAAGTPEIAGALSALQQGVLVARDGRLAVAGGPDVAAPIAGDQGPVRHVAVDPRFGVVYVRDLAGGDDIIADTPTGQIRLHRRSEVSHPAWMPDGDLVWGQGGTLRFWSRDTQQVTASSRPVPGGTVFSPVALNTHAVLAAVAEPPAGSPTEDEYLSDLWRYDRRGGEWRPMTRFHATQDRWSIIRTPEMGPNGIEFIRVRGTASATKEPTFERWSLRGRVAVREEVLPSERYLAGFENGARLWNLPVAEPSTWMLARETAGGGLHELGCGAVAVDPVDVTDPDHARRPGQAGTEPDYPVPPPNQQPPAHEVAVIVGDYSGESGASNAAQAILHEYGQGAQVKVVDSDSSPLALKPGSWGAIMWIGADGDPVNAIQHFWNKLPQFADRSWVVAP